MRASIRPRRAQVRVIAALVVLVLLSPVLPATWSIILVDTSTGEIAVGCATCLTGLDLELYVPVIVVGTGGGCCQARIDGSGRNRRIIWDELPKGTPPGDILKLINDADPNFSSRQIGIVDMLGRRAAHTGTNTGGWSGHVKGRQGNISYAIQGNVLTGEPVILAARDAALNTPGDLSEKLMAAMEAARAIGGDGRCSCGSDPEGCGSPPPDFDKSAHVGFMMLSRFGDVDGDCDGGIGCVNGVYYMNLNVADQTAADEDPVIQLRGLFDAWRQELLGRPDHLLSEKQLTSNVLPGNGTATTTMEIKLFDWAKNPIVSGGHQVVIAHAQDSAGLSSIGDVVDHGDGTYSVALTSGVGQGIDRFEVRVDDGQGPVLLFPYPELENGPTLLADQDHLSASAGGTVTFSLIGPAAENGRHYLLLGSLSGTEPGIDLGGGIVLPLNPDVAMMCTYVDRNGPVLVDTEGFLSTDGSGSCQLVAPAGLLDRIVGLDVHFAYLLFQPINYASNALSITIDP